MSVTKRSFPIQIVILNVVLLINLKGWYLLLHARPNTSRYLISSGKLSRSRSCMEAFLPSGQLRKTQN
ncbi:MAG: hypothetical protein J6M44_10285, partial [Butyrivibrio sp.]|nr:hypothetical protein [Butyrivibrio sp.]